MIERNTGLVDICFLVCTTLDRAGMRAVLVGGSAATFYAPARCQSLDADFVVVLSSSTPSPTAALGSLGFVEKGGAYHHPLSSYTIDFPPGPLSIGGEVVRDYNTVKRNRQTLYVISRTDCVLDRLAAFYHWDDRSSLGTAVDVARSGPVDMGKIRAWSEDERQLVKFDEFAARYADDLKSRRR